MLERNYKVNWMFYAFLGVGVIAVSIFIIVVFSHGAKADELLLLLIMCGFILWLLRKGIPTDFTITCSQLIVKGWKMFGFKITKMVIYKTEWENIVSYYPFVTSRIIRIRKENKKTTEFGFIPLFLENPHDFHEDIKRFAKNADIAE